MAHNSQLDLYEIRNSVGDLRHRKTLKNMDVDPRDPEHCREVLRRVAKQHGIDPYSAELLVWEGRKKERYRL